MPVYKRAFMHIGLIAWIGCLLQYPVATSQTLHTLPIVGEYKQQEIRDISFDGKYLLCMKYGDFKRDRLLEEREIKLKSGQSADVYKPSLLLIDRDTGQ